MIYDTASGRPAIDKVFRWSLSFEARDIWIGLYWKRIGNCLDVSICFLPCCPLHLCWHWSDPEQN